MQSVLVKRALIVLGSALLIGGATLGVSYAQGAPGAPSASGQRGERMHQLMDAVATNLGISTDQLQQAFQSARTQVGMPDRSQLQGRWHGMRGAHKDGARSGADRFQGAAAGMDTVASTLGITRQELRQELQGKSLADVARDHNVDPSVVSNALKSQADSRIDQLMDHQVPARQRG